VEVIVAPSRKTHVLVFGFTVLVVAVAAWAWAGGATALRELPLCQAVQLAQVEAEKQRIDLSCLRLTQAKLEYDDGSRAWPDGQARKGRLFWLLVWNWREPRLGGELSARVYDDGTVVFQRHGP
jgi:hypothetical protein